MTGYFDVEPQPGDDALADEVCQSPGCGNPPGESMEDTIYEGLCYPCAKDDHDFNSAEDDIESRREIRRY